MKKCNKCGEEKSTCEFNKQSSSKDGYFPSCKVCRKRDNIERYQLKSGEIKSKAKQYRDANKDKISKNKHQKYLKNKQEILFNNKVWRDRNKEVIKEKSQEYYLKNKDKISQAKKLYRKERIQKDGMYVCESKIRDSILKSFKRALNGNKSKKSKTSEILKCSIDNFKIHIESQFIKGMTWENHGKVWDLDHIIPISSATSEEEIYLLNHWSNFQPLDSNINRNIKKDNIYPLTNLELNLTWNEK